MRQKKCRKYLSNRINTGLEEAKDKTTFRERNAADPHNSSSEGLPLANSERLSGNAHAVLKDNAKIQKTKGKTYNICKNAE